MRYIGAMAASTVMSALLIVGLVALRTAVDQRMKLPEARDTKIGAGEALFLRTTSGIADYGWLLILPIFAVSYYAVRRSRPTRGGESLPASRDSAVRDRDS